MTTFERFPSLTRFSGPVFVTEKIDGTNAQLCFVPYTEDLVGHPQMIGVSNGLALFAGSRTRWITPSNDNFGFAKWAERYIDTLRNILGEGRHYGEWWGAGIQRGYGLKHKIFSLFNTERWGDALPENDIGLSVVPLLYSGAFYTSVFNSILDQLKERGSYAAPGYMNPEGICIYDTRSGVGFKKTYDYDDTGKGGLRDTHGNVYTK